VANAGICLVRWMNTRLHLSESDLVVNVERYSLRFEFHVYFIGWIYCLLFRGVLSLDWISRVSCVTIDAMRFIIDIIPDSSFYGVNSKVDT
jgi:hypothetical protein